MLVMFNVIRSSPQLEKKSRLKVVLMPPREEEPGSCLDCTLVSRIPRRQTLHRPTRSSRPGNRKPKTGAVKFICPQPLRQRLLGKARLGREALHAAGPSPGHISRGICSPAGLRGAPRGSPFPQHGCGFGTFSIPASSRCSSSTCSSFSSTLFSALRRAELVRSASSWYCEAALCERDRDPFAINPGARRWAKHPGPLLPPRFEAA